MASFRMRTRCSCQPGLPPPLMLAFARAAFLQRHVLTGPSTLFHYLQAHWELDAKRSWLGQLVSDVSLVVAFVPAARMLRDAVCPVREVLVSMQEHPKWWQKCVVQAQKAFIQDLELWYSRAKEASPAAPLPQASQAFQCPYCPATFRLRRYLCSHMAKRHHTVSPARHFVVEPVCVACLRRYSSVAATQNHLRYSVLCLRRAVRVMSPLTLQEIADAEAEQRQQLRLLKKGQWQAFRALQPVLQSFGPSAPTYEERFPAGYEGCSIAELHRAFRPRESHLAWIEEYCSQTSALDTATASVDFWSRKPSLSAEVPVLRNRRLLLRVFA